MFQRSYKQGRIVCTYYAIICTYTAYLMLPTETLACYYFHNGCLKIPIKGKFVQDKKSKPS